MTGSANGACQQCHQYEHHQADLVPERTRMPEGFPFEDGALACYTCHDVPACDGKDVDPRDPWFLRGGPYERVGTFCGTCHLGALAERFSPHGGMDPETEAEACAHCHLDVPDRNARIEDLRIISLDICIGCHHADSHAGISVHRGILAPDMRLRAEAAKLPLGEGGRMVCLTCHDPHPAGTLPGTEARQKDIGQPLFTEGWLADVLAPAAREREATLGGPIEPAVREPDFMRRSVTDGTLCTTCHEMTD